MFDQNSPELSHIVPPPSPWILSFSLLFHSLLMGGDPLTHNPLGIKYRKQLYFNLTNSERYLMLTPDRWVLYCFKKLQQLYKKCFNVAMTITYRDTDKTHQEMTKKIRTLYTNVHIMDFKLYNWGPGHVKTQSEEAFKCLITENDFVFVSVYLSLIHIFKNSPNSTFFPYLSYSFRIYTIHSGTYTQA